MLSGTSSDGYEFSVPRLIFSQHYVDKKAAAAGDPDPNRSKDISFSPWEAGRLVEAIHNIAQKNPDLNFNLSK